MRIILHRTISRERSATVTPRLFLPYDWNDRDDRTRHQGSTGFLIGPSVLYRPRIRRCATAQRPTGSWFFPPHLQRYRRMAAAPGSAARNADDDRPRTRRYRPVARRSVPRVRSDLRRGSSSRQRVHRLLTVRTTHD